MRNENYIHYYTGKAVHPCDPCLAGRQAWPKKSPGYGRDLNYSLAIPLSHQVHFSISLIKILIRFIIIGLILVQ